MMAHTLRRKSDGQLEAGSPARLSLFNSLKPSAMGTGVLNQLAAELSRAADHPVIRRPIHTDFGTVPIRCTAIQSTRLIRNDLELH